MKRSLWAGLGGLCAKELAMVVCTVALRLSSRLQAHAYRAGAMHQAVGCTRLLVMVVSAPAVDAVKMQPAVRFANPKSFKQGVVDVWGKSATEFKLCWNCSELDLLARWPLW